jgi:protein-tyrosine phosphatase
MTPGQIMALHRHLDDKGYKKAEFADDFWTFCYQVFDEGKKRHKPLKTIYEWIVDAVKAEQKRMKERA